MRIKLTGVEMWQDWKNQACILDSREFDVWVETSTIATMLREPGAGFTGITFCGGWWQLVRETPEQIDAIEAQSGKAVRP